MGSSKKNTVCYCFVCYLCQALHVWQNALCLGYVTILFTILANSDKKFIYLYLVQIISNEMCETLIFKLVILGVFSILVFLFLFHLRRWLQTVPALPRGQRFGIGTISFNKTNFLTIGALVPNRIAPGRWVYLKKNTSCHCFVCHLCHCFVCHLCQVSHVWQNALCLGFFYLIYSLE
jgi:hypothetical protein